MPNLQPHSKTEKYCNKLSNKLNIKLWVHPILSPSTLEVTSKPTILCLIYSIVYCNISLSLSEVVDLAYNCAKFSILTKRKSIPFKVDTLIGDSKKEIPFLAISLCRLPTSICGF
eukprot:TRINITY_DN7347_c0_g1_i1.p1 TRINITY_DN7347_c0_g1~~TRINITY_DN7347_c0_g1_i1.p1  ORF type:complete len:115 (-),score=1.55 TRINITY_DN7347_c0_g1_i1:345-689(-)